MRPQSHELHAAGAGAKIRDMLERLQTGRTDPEMTELEAVLGSGLFVKSPNLTKLLSYICEAAWDGKADLLKEYNLATEALGRSPDFDPGTSATVRVEVHRLREKLKKYYDTEGADHSLVITLRPGSYVPQFVRRESDSCIPAQQHTSIRQKSSLENGRSESSPIPEIEQRASTPDFVEAGALWRLWERPIPSTRRKFIWQSIFLAVVIVVLAEIVLGIFENRWLQPAVDVVTFPTASVQNPPALVGTEPRGVGILPGSHHNYIDRAGNLWLGDRYYRGGSIGVNPIRQITGAPDQGIFRTYRWGEFSYDIPLRPGRYDLWLYFAETKYEVGSVGNTGIMGRVFDIQVNRSTVLHLFNVFSDAGGSYTADARVFKNLSPGSDGTLHIRFVTSGNGVPFVNAIRVIPSLSGRIWPIRIIAQDTAYTDSQGKTWNADEYFRGGMITHRPRQILEHPDPGLFEGERYGNFTYAIPVGSGKYALRLYFSEQYFGPQNPEGHGRGSRVFNVICNDQVLLKDFDIFKEAGGPNRPVVKTFHGLEANGQGKLLLRFDSKVNYALVNAIEVVDESP